MDLFINNILNINDEIEKISDNIGIVNSKLKNKQYLVYYLYRIICKYNKVFLDIANSEIIKTIYTALNIDKNVMWCSPMNGRMPTDIDLLDTVFLSMLELLTTYSEKSSSIDTNTSKDLEDFLLIKSNEENIKNDIKLLSELVPNLSKPYLFV